ncbi:Thioredoxin-like fold-containing protein [Dioscorea alata]|uniref:Thioredoxin-like fold-containing protein n=1 Tax=Dioscorea alata TaxID=55571 RepID=A0ACB7W139_DIOAL|nr:Thioredoxin-like fold-containing protein [Dioscorea alata]
MDHPELSLGPSLSTFALSANSSSTDSESTTKKKRKYTWDEPMRYTNIELNLNDPLPLDWEQCLDLHSGRMYYLNRKTLKRSLTRPKEQKLDLELNISNFSGSMERTGSASSDDLRKQSSSSGNMVAVACANCHLLVMLCRSSPLCPNCKYMHPLLPKQQTPSRGIEAVKPLETLSLLH